MVQEPVAHARLVDVARLGVGNVEGSVRAVAVCLYFQVGVEREDVVHKP